MTSERKAGTAIVVGAIVAAMCLVFSCGQTPAAAAEEPSRGLGGPTSHAMHQPTGPLSGVTVFVGAGHGWTADTNGVSVAENPVTPTPAWCLQRPVLLGMAEDYGNLEQLNYMVHYAFNAGATVVPLRPAGHQVIEIVLDNDDPGVTYEGSWVNTNSVTATRYYENHTTTSGIPFRKADTTSNGPETAVAHYDPGISVTDFYPVYCFTRAGTDRVPQLYRIKHSGGVSEVVVDHRNVGDGWVWLGEYHFDASDENYVEISNLSSVSGVVVSDAIRWGCGMGDVARPLGTNGVTAISGYPRSEEAQRYWAESEWGNKAVGFDGADLWNSSGSDYNDNVSCGGRLARQMNQVPAGGVQVDRWKRIHLEFHTNAATGAGRGSFALITTASSGPTTYQEDFAETLSNEFESDLFILDDEFEHEWQDFVRVTYESNYGAISQAANGDEFDATILEGGHHDQQEDAELLRDSRVRAAMARAALHGIIKFLNTLPGSEVSLDFAPDPPRDVRIEDLGAGDARISWIAPLYDDARGDPATGYVVYVSTNGYGFGQPVVLGNVLTTTLSGILTEKTMYYRVAATNAGGESTPSEVVAIRRPQSGVAEVIVVNGFDRLRREQNPIVEFTQPAGYAGLSIERPYWRQANSFDYVRQFADALAANTVGFVSCSNEAITDQHIDLQDYKIALWILGMESEEDSTFSSLERNYVSSFLNNGGGLFVSGGNLGYDLIGQGNGTTFMRDVLKANYVADDSGDVTASGTGGIFSDIGVIDFDLANGSPYRVYSPDELATWDGSTVNLTYQPSGGVAGVQYDFCVYRTVVLGFPFEAITSASARAALMERIIDFLGNISGALPFDYLSLDGGFNYGPDCDIDLHDYALFGFCLNGPENPHQPGSDCAHMDGDGDGDVDLDDFALFQELFTGSL